MTTHAKLGQIRVREGFNSRAVLPEIPKLAADIEERGQLEAISVREKKRHLGSELDHRGTYVDVSYEVVFGHRRLAALRWLRENKRSALVRPNSGIFPGDHSLTGLRHGSYMLLVADDFPVRVEVVTMTDEEAYLANLAENAHREGTRQVDVYARIDMLLREGYDREKVRRAAGIADATLAKRMSTFRRLSPEIVKRWQKIERPEHEPPWNFLADVARGTVRAGKRGGDPATRLVPATTDAQLSVWRRLYAEGDVTRAPEPAWRERQHLRPVREVKKKLAERQKKPADEFNEGVLCALEWVLGKDVEL